MDENRRESFVDERLRGSGFGNEGIWGCGAAPAEGVKRGRMGSHRGALFVSVCIFRRRMVLRSSARCALRDAGQS